MIIFETARSADEHVCELIKFKTAQITAFPVRLREDILLCPGCESLRLVDLSELRAND